MLPISPFVYSYVYFGIVLLLPDYISIWLSCNHVGSYYSTLILSRTIGDVMRYFILGVMMLCYRGYQINWELLWGNISCIFVGFVYLLHVVRTKYYLFGRHDLPYNDSHTMTLNGWSFLVTFTLSLIIALVISYHSQNQTLLKTPQEEESNQYVDISSDIEITGENPNRTDLSSFQVWWDTVNAFHYMNERRKFITVIFVSIPINRFDTIDSIDNSLPLQSPLYFILANTIPVISKRRPMHGWCKHVGCISLLAFPFVAIGLKPPPFAWTTVLLISFFIAFNVFISTHPLREPTHMWLRVYSLTGMTMCSITMYALIAEIDNLFWQYFSMNLGPCADTIPLLMASSGVLVVLYVFIDNLMNEGLPDAAYGAVMSVVTHCIYMCLPQLVLHRCYSNHTYVRWGLPLQDFTLSHSTPTLPQIQITDKAQTVAKFFLSMLFTTLFHVSMSGNEFRMSLYYLLLVLFTFHAFLQLSAYYGSVILFGSDSNIQAPLDLSTFWA